MNEPENQSATTPLDETIEPVTETTESTEQTTETTSEESIVTEAVTVESDEVTTESVSVPAPEENEVSSESITAAEADDTAETSEKTFKWHYYAVAGGVVALIVLGVLYVMDVQGRISIPIFTGVQNFVAKQTAVATVNGTDISEYDFNVSVSQITTGAQVQGADLSDPEVLSQINSQAIEMLVNTELLKQEASRRGIAITDEAVTERLTSLETEVGGAEVLRERMKQFNIDDKTLRRDIYNELTIQALLDQVFEETAITVSEEEVQSLYAGAGGSEAGLPPLEEVREQVEAQIRSGKEQEVVTTFIDTLRETATIEVLI